MLIQSAALWQLARHRHHLCLRRNGPARRENVILPLSHDSLVAKWLPFFRNMKVVIFFRLLRNPTVFFPLSRGFSQKVVCVWKPAEHNQPSPVDGSFKLRVGTVMSVRCNKITTNFSLFNKNVLGKTKEKKLKLTLQVERLPILFAYMSHIHVGRSWQIIVWKVRPVENKNKIKSSSSMKRIN